MSRRAWYVLLAIPFAATLFPGLYDRLDPRLFGMPFFYWYQLVWTVLCGVVLAVVNAATGRPPRA